MATEAFVMERVKRDWLAAPRKQKVRVIEKWSGMLGVTPKTIYSQINTGRQRRAGDRKIEGIEDYALIVHQIKKKTPEQFGEISTDQALRIAIREGSVPESLAGKEATINRVGRDLGMNKRKRRVQRFQAERPNQIHHVDGSSSKFLYIKKELPNGDFLLGLHAGTKGYKNKPVPIRLRPWIYGLTDDHSGVFVGRYVAAYGENDMDNLDFLSWAWGKNDDTPFFGVPEKIKGDKGPMMRGNDAKDFFDRLDVEIDESIPGVKEAHGKIERPWRTVWQRFEKPFFVCSEWKKFEITLSDLNAQFYNFLEELNNRQHRYDQGVSRINMWKKIAFNGGALALPDNALATISKRIERTVGTDGCISLDNVLYEVKGLHDAKVWVYKGVFDDRMVAMDQATGKKYEVKTFEPNKVGEYTGHKHTPHQKAVAAAQNLELSNVGLYAEPKPTGGNLVSLPTPVKETINLEDPLDTKTYASMAEAMQDFMSMCGVFELNKENREAIQKLILENGLSRQFVIDLALEIQVEDHKRRIS